MNEAGNLAALIGRECSRVTVDRYSPTLVMHFLVNGPAMRIEIGAPIYLTVDGHESHLANDDPAAMGPVLRLVGRTLAAAHRVGDGLRLDFGDACWLEVEAAGPEPWYLSEDASLLVGPSRD